MKRLLIVLAGALAASIAAAACAGGGTEVVEKIVEVPVVEEVVKEVEVERVVEVEKEVVKEVEVERVVEVEVEKLLVATPTPPPVTGGPQFGGTLRIVSQASIASLDPAFDGSYVAIAVGSHLFESPLGWNLSLEDQPRMANSWDISSDGLTWTFHLRPGMLFHNGEPVTAQDVVTSFGRYLNGAHAAATLMKEFTDNENQFTVIDDLTFTVNLLQPYGAIATSIARPWASMYAMPHSVIHDTSFTAPAPEWVGSGPYEFEDWRQGDRVTLRRFEDYVGRDEASSLYAGKQVAYIDQLIWLEVPSEETKIAGLETGEWDIVDGAGLDFFQRTDQNPDLVVPVYKPGHRSDFRPWAGFPPFDDLLARRALQVGIDIEATMFALGGRELWDLCPAVFYCGTPLETSIGADQYYNVNDKELARELVAQSSYDGETVVLLNPNDYATITPVGIVIKKEIEAIGFNVEQPALDWATVLGTFGEERSETYAGLSGWASHWCCGEPLSDFYLDGDGWFLAQVPELKRLRIEYAQATDQKERFEIVEQLQLEAYKNVVIVYLGTWYAIFPHTSDLKNFEVKAFPYYANVWLER